MVQGFERREVIQDANERSTSLENELRTIKATGRSVPGIRTPRRANFSRVGETQRKLANALGGAAESVSRGLGMYAEKKMEDWKVEGAMARAEGQTQEELYKNGNRFHRAGWQAMNAKIAGDELYQNELSHIENEGKSMDTKQFQAYLSDKVKELKDNLPANDTATREMINSYALDMYPKLVSKQIVAHNAYNKTQTIDSLRRGLASTAATDTEKEVQELLDPAMYELAPEDFGDTVAAGIMDAYKLGNGAPEKFELAMKGKMVELGLSKDSPKPADVSSITNLIGMAESNNNYNAVFNGENPDLTSMTIKEVLDMQSGKKLDPRSTAVGKYQIIHKTLSELKDKFNIPDDRVFDEDLQEELGLKLLERRGLKDYLSGKISMEDFQMNLAQEWAAIPKDESGLSYYHKDGLNKARVDLDKVRHALQADKEGLGIFDYLNEIGASPATINKVRTARDSYQREKSAKFGADRLLTEDGIKKSAIDLSDEDLIQEIETVKTEKGYTDAWANSLFRSALSQREVARKERKKAIKIQTMIDTNSVINGTKDEQQKAIDIIKTTALSANPEALDPNSPNAFTAQRQAMTDVYRFMHSNGIKDTRITKQWEAATTGDIIDAQGKVTPAAMNAYISYLDAKQAVNDPLFADNLLSSETKTLFHFANNYAQGEDNVDVEKALATAHTLIQEQNSLTGVNNLPWWEDADRAEEITEKLMDDTIPGFLKLFGLGDRQAQMRWSINEESVEAAAKHPSILARIHNEAASLWSTKKHWNNPKAAQDAAVKEASDKILGNVEYIAGSFVYTGNKPSINQRLGLGSIKNGANMVVSRLMSELGPVIWEDYNQTNLYPENQHWVDDVLSTPGNLIEKAQEKTRGVPDFDVRFNESSNALLLYPYEDYERTRPDAVPFILSVEMLKEAADLIRTENEAGFRDWVDSTAKSINPTRYKKLKDSPKSHIGRM